MDRILYRKAAQLYLLQESSIFRGDKPDLSLFFFFSLLTRHHYFHTALLYAEHLVVCWKKLLPSVA